MQSNERAPHEVAGAPATHSASRRRGGRTRRGLASILHGRGRLASRAIAAVVALGVAVSSPIAAPIIAPGTGSPAYAADYPSWDDVQKAKADTADAEQAVADVTALIAQLADQVEATRQAAEQRMQEYIAAQEAYEAAVRRTDALQSQADAAAAKSADAERNAGQIAAQLYRTGGEDLGLEVVVGGSGSDAEELLGKLGSMEKMVERTSSVYALAEEERNNAASLAAQAGVAEDERQKLQAAAEQAWQAAVDAQAAAEAALAESEAQQATLEAQLAFLKDAEAKTTAAYEEGERKRKEEEERKRKEEEERRRQAAAAAGVPSPSSSGWVKPMSGWLNDGFGGRSTICTDGGCSAGFHSGQDIVAGCGSTIYAAYSGTVRFAGYSGTWGNYIQIDHGGGVWSAYAHIAPGGIYVSYGQWVEAGQAIAAEGTTGASTGCHLHFEIWIGGSRIDPLPFMRDRGITW